MRKVVEIIDIAIKQGTGKTGSPYEYVEVTYKSEYQGKPEYKGYKALKFNTDEALYVALSSAKKGDVFDVIMEKNAAGYWQWLEIARQDSVPQGESKPVTERQAAYAAQDDKRQTLIVRQSSLKAAVDFAVSVGLDETQTLSLAETFENWVNR